MKGNLHTFLHHLPDSFRMCIPAITKYGIARPIPCAEMVVFFEDTILHTHAAVNVFVFCKGFDVLLVVAYRLLVVKNFKRPWVQVLCSLYCTERTPLPSHQCTSEITVTDSECIT